MKKLLLLSLVFICSCSQNNESKFYECCKTYQESGFEERLAKLFPLGSNADELQTLLGKADKQKIVDGSSVYIFDYLTGQYSDQGLVVSITIDNSTNTISAVKSGISSN